MNTAAKDTFRSRARLRAGGAEYEIFRLDALAQAGIGHVERLPLSLRILLENLLRHEDGSTVTRDDIVALASWDPHSRPSHEIAYRPARVLLQDFTGVPAIVDLAAMRDALARVGGDPRKINPLLPVDLVIDHSVQVDSFGSAQSFILNAERELGRNRERYEFLRWGQQAFENFRVVPPDTGIVHQVNLEHLARVVFTDPAGSHSAGRAYPDTLVGADSHTTMINGLGVLGWGVGGIEAEAAMLGQPITMLVPQVVGFRLTGSLPAGATATDLVLTVTQKLRSHGVVGKFVEFHGPGLDTLSLPDRATIANMAPEYGATIGLFPVDAESLRYLQLTGRGKDQIALVEAYCKEQGLFRTAETTPPVYSATLELDLSTVEPCIAGPKRPQDRVPLRRSQAACREAIAEFIKGSHPEADAALMRIWVEKAVARDSAAGPSPRAESSDAVKSPVAVTCHGQTFRLQHGSIVIAAITSCTNTSNPAVMLAAGLLARKAVARGLRVKPWVKTSLAPGSQVVADYLRKAGLLADLEMLNFHLVGFGCTTCIGNSGPLPEPIATAITANKLVTVSVLSGNRNFEGRINPHVRANYLASPPLVVAYALAGDIDINLLSNPLGNDSTGKPVYLEEIWPTADEVNKTMRSAVEPQMFSRRYATVDEGDERWRAIEVPSGATFTWNESSTYIKNPPFFQNTPEAPPGLMDVQSARVLVMLGDSVTTDHISPAGAIPPDGPAGQYLVAHGVPPASFNSFGARRGNHEVMMRGTFGNIRLRNLLAPGTEGGWTVHLPEGTRMSIYDAAMKYREEATPLLVLAGKEYGTGSSRDWAAKGTMLLGVRAVIAESFERIHRSNLAGMGVLPLQFPEGQGIASIGLTGQEIYSIEGIAAGLEPGSRVRVSAQDGDGRSRRFEAIVRLDTPREVDYYRHGGILPFVLRNLLRGP
ncbi:MAG: aconitate hydratase AcnA [Acidobacteriota bacterium]